jgi:hypothetical protein
LWSLVLLLQYLFFEVLFYLFYGKEREASNASRLKNQESLSALLATLGSAFCAHASRGGSLSSEAGSAFHRFFILSAGAYLLSLQAFLMMSLRHLLFRAPRATPPQASQLNFLFSNRRPTAVHPPPVLQSVVSEDRSSGFLVD